MSQINLLPWREELRKRRQKEFGITAGVAVLLMLGVIGGVHLWYQDQIEFQNSRNAFLNKEIKQLDARIKEIRNPRLLRRLRFRYLEEHSALREFRVANAFHARAVDEPLGEIGLRQVVVDVPAVAGIRDDSVRSEQGEVL